MNALSELRSLAYPGLRTESLAAAKTDAFTQTKLPIAELEKLSPDFAARLPGIGGIPTTSFDQVLSSLAQDVNSKQAAAGESVKGLLSGDNISLHQTMINMEEASVSFQLMVEVRNKLLESYQELMRLQI